MSASGRAFWRALDRFELPALKWVKRNRAGGAVDQATALLTRAGEHGTVWYGIAAAGSIVDPARRRLWREAGFAVATTYALNSLIKPLANRRRPSIASFGTPTALSFPSAHAATSFAAARTMSQLAPAPPFYLLAFAMVASRLHFLVHYPSDLAAGALLGDLRGRATVRRWKREAPESPTR